LRTLAFAPVPTASRKTIGLQRGSLILYIISGIRNGVVVHPAFEEVFSTLSKMSGITHAQQVSFYHDSNLSRFPKRDNGHGLIHYGIAFSFFNITALREFVTELQGALALTSPLAPDKTLSEEIDEIETETNVVAKARKGQGRFRADLLNYWQGHCAVTGVSAPELLRASHIKAWRDSRGIERLDAFNGLLLAVHLDALFDRGLISFQDSGEMLVSKRLSSKDREVFGLMPRARKLLLSVPHLVYLNHHRDRFQASEQKS
jgi:putative restriction endonuclease